MQIMHENHEFLIIFPGKKNNVLDKVVNDYYYTCYKVVFYYFFM